MRRSLAPRTRRRPTAGYGSWLAASANSTTRFALLEPLCETTHYMGGNAVGASPWLSVGNLVVASSFEAIGEATILATKAGLDPQDVLGVLHVTDFKSPIFDGGRRRWCAATST